MNPLAFLFGCTHPLTTWPRKRGRGCYIVCLDCGKEMEYDWENMRVVTTSQREPEAKLANEIL
jgi:hypothetical protein